jgi:hypothetical protein
MMRPSGVRQGFFGAPTKQVHHGEPFGTNLGEPELRRTRARHDDQIDAWGQQIGPRPEAFAAEAPDPVSLHGAPDFASRDHAEARFAGPVGLRRNEECEMLGAHPAADLLRTDEGAMAPQPAIAPESAAGSLRARAPCGAISCRQRGPDERVPSGGGSSAPCGRHVWPFGRGSRAFARGGRCGVGRCASRRRKESIRRRSGQAWRPRRVSWRTAHMHRASACEPTRHAARCHACGAPGQVPRRRKAPSARFSLRGGCGRCCILAPPP